MQKRNATAAVIGAGDYIGSAIARRFAAEGYTIFAGRRTAEKLEKLKQEIEAAGGSCVARGLDARKEEDVTAFLQEADAHAPLEVVHHQSRRQCAVPDPRKRPSASSARCGRWRAMRGFLAGREVREADAGAGQGHDPVHRRDGEHARRRGLCGVLERQGGPAQSWRRAWRANWGRKNIHVAHLIIDAGVDTEFVRERIKARGGDPGELPPDTLMNPESVANAYWYLHSQSRDGWTFELDLRPYAERW